MSSPDEKTTTGLLTFEFHRSNLFRIVHADGVFGGVTPNGYVMMSFFSQVAPTPTKVTHEFDGKKLGPETSRDVSQHIQRELEVGVIVDLTIAKSLFDWLKEKIDMLEREETKA